MQNKFFLYIIAFLFFWAGTVAAEEFKTIKGNGYVITKEIPISEYSQIKIGGYLSPENPRKPLSDTDYFSFHYSQNPQTKSTASFVIDIDENLLPYLDVQIKNNELIINAKQDCRLLPTCLKINSQSSWLVKIGIEGSFLFSVLTELKSENLEVLADGIAKVIFDKPVYVDAFCKMKIRGVADVQATDFLCSDILVDTDDCGKLTLKGKAQKGKYKARGDSRIHAYNFVTTNLDCNVTDAGEIRAQVSEVLNAKASAAGELKYKGFPRTDIQTTDAGKIKRIK